MTEPKIWRVRMRVGYDRECSEEAWSRDEVGIWYGAWSFSDWQAAKAQFPQDPWQALRILPQQELLGWSSLNLDPVWRFEKISSDDWTLVFLPSVQQLGLARLGASIQSDDDHPLNYQVTSNGGREIWKYRRIVEKKSFRLADLPDAYRLLPAQGRGNVHQFQAMREHARLLAEHHDVSSLIQALSQLKFEAIIRLLGAAAWESVCTAFLTLEHGFVPTGLQVGSTLADVDIVGRRVPDGIRIVAQCKKQNHSIEIDGGFASIVKSDPGPLKAFYFSYGGCHGPIPKAIEVIGEKEIIEWATSDRGKMYSRFLVGGPNSI